MNVFYFSESRHGAIQLRASLKDHCPNALIDVLYVPLKDLIYFENVEEDKIILIDLSPWDEHLFSQVIGPLKILEKADCLVETNTFVILGEYPNAYVESTLATSPLIDGYFVIGEDPDGLFNLLSMKLTQAKTERKFAKLRGMNNEIELKLPFSLTSISLKESKLLTHHEIKVKNPIVQNSWFDEFNLDTLTIHGGISSASLFEYNFTLPITKGAFRPKKGDISYEKLEKYINTPGSGFIQKQNDISIIGDDRELARLAKIIDLESNSHVHHHKEVDGCISEIIKIQPELIFVKIKDEAQVIKETEQRETGIAFIELPKLIDKIKEQKYYIPILIFLNSPSASLAVQQVFNYSKILAFTEEPTRSLILKIISLFRTSSAREMTLERPVILRGDNSQSSGWLNANCILHELSESEISFSYEGDILIGAWVRLEFPFPITARIVKRNASPKGGKFVCYQAQIMGLQEPKASKLRVFINLAFEDPHEFITYYLNHPDLLKEHIEKHIKGNKVAEDENEEENLAN